MNNNIKGGKLLEKGGYGCIYHPHIDCDGNETKNLDYVSKISLYNSDILKEIEMGKIIKTIIPNYNNFFVPIEKSCTISINKISNDLIGDCSIIKNNKETNNFIINNVPYVNGKTLNDFFSTIDKQPNFSKTFYKIFLHLYIAIKTLQEYNILHYDIKPANIMVNNKNIPLILDFGISFFVNEKDITKNYDKFYIYAPDYYYWSLQSNIISWILTDNKKLEQIITDKDITNIINDYFINNQIFGKSSTLLSAEFINKYQVRTYNYYIKNFTNIKGSECIKRLIKSWREWDIYSLAQIFLHFHHQYQHNFENEKYNDTFIKILISCIDHYPTNKLTEKQIIYTMQSIIPDDI